MSGSGLVRVLYAAALLGAAVGSIAYGYATGTAWYWAGIAIFAYIAYSLLAKSRLPWSASPQIEIDGEMIPLADARRGAMNFILPAVLQSLENTGLLVRRDGAEMFVSHIGHDMENGQNTNVLEKADIRCADCGIKISNGWLMAMFVRQRDSSMMPIFGDLPGTVPTDDGTCPRCQSDTFAIIHKVR